MRPLLAPFLLPLVLGAAEPAPAARLVAPDASPEAAEVVLAGRAAAAQAMTKLLAELTVALAADGAAGAVEVCHLKALPLTAARDPKLPQVTGVKRTSLKVRNPANAPDAAERLVLDHVAALAARGEALPEVLLQRVEPADAAPEWRVYRPVVMQTACLACHGEPLSQSPALRAALQARYPQDAALGYRAGDWRGLIRVSVAPRPPPPAGL